MIETLRQTNVKKRATTQSVRAFRSQDLIGISNNKYRSFQRTKKVGVVLTPTFFVGVAVLS